MHTFNSDKLIYPAPNNSIDFKVQAMLGVQEPSLKFYARHAKKWEEIIFITRNWPTPRAYCLG